MAMPPFFWFLRPEEAFYFRPEESLRMHKSPVSTALKNLIVAIEVKDQEDRRFQERVVSSRLRQEYITREQLSFLVGELRNEKKDREIKSLQIAHLRNDVVKLKHELSIVRTTFQKVLGDSLPSQHGLLYTVEKKEGAAERDNENDGGYPASNAREESDGRDSPNLSSLFHDVGSQPVGGESRSRQYETGICAEFDAPPSDGSSTTELTKASICDDPTITLQGKRKYSGADYSLEGGLQKKKRSGSCSDNLSESQQLKKRTSSTEEHPLLRPKVVSFVLQFVGKAHYLFIGGVHTVWKSVYELEIDKGKHQTYTIIPLASVSTLNYACGCGLDLKSGRFKGNATGSPLSLSWWAGHIAPFDTIIRFQKLRKGDPINTCGGAASAGRLDILRILLEKLQWRCDNASICINAAEVRGIYCIESFLSRLVFFSQPPPPPCPGCLLSLLPP